MTGMCALIPVPHKVALGNCTCPTLRGGLKAAQQERPHGYHPTFAPATWGHHTTLLLAVSSKDWITFSLCLNLICSMSSALRLLNFYEPRVTQ